MPLTAEEEVIVKLFDSSLLQQNAFQGGDVQERLKKQDHALLMMKSILTKNDAAMREYSALRISHEQLQKQYNTVKWESDNRALKLSRSNTALRTQLTECLESLQAMGILKNQLTQTQRSADNYEKENESLRNLLVLMNESISNVKVLNGRNSVVGESKNSDNMSREMEIKLQQEIQDLREHLSVRNEQLSKLDVRAKKIDDQLVNYMERENRLRTFLKETLCQSQQKAEKCNVAVAIRLLLERLIDHCNIEKITLPLERLCQLHQDITETPVRGRGEKRAASRIEDISTELEVKRPKNLEKPPLKPETIKPTQTVKINGGKPTDSIAHRTRQKGRTPRRTQNRRATVWGEPPKVLNIDVDASDSDRPVSNHELSPLKIKEDLLHKNNIVDEVNALKAKLFTDIGAEITEKPSSRLHSSPILSLSSLSSLYDISDEQNEIFYQSKNPPRTSKHRRVPSGSAPQQHCIETDVITFPKVSTSRTKAKSCRQETVVASQERAVTKSIEQSTVQTVTSDDVLPDRSMRTANQNAPSIKPNKLIGCVDSEGEDDDYDGVSEATKFVSLETIHSQDSVQVNQTVAINETTFAVDQTIQGLTSSNESSASPDAVVTVLERTSSEIAATDKINESHFIASNEVTDTIPHSTNDRCSPSRSTKDDAVSELADIGKVRDSEFVDSAIVPDTKSAIPLTVSTAEPVPLEMDDSKDDGDDNNVGCKVIPELTESPTHRIVDVAAELFTSEPVAVDSDAVNDFSKDESCCTAEVIPASAGPPIRPVVEMGVDVSMICHETTVRSTATALHEASSNSCHSENGASSSSDRRQSGRPCSTDSSRCASQSWKVSPVFTRLFLVDNATVDDTESTDAINAADDENETCTVDGASHPVTVSNSTENSSNDAVVVTVDRHSDAPIATAASVLSPGSQKSVNSSRSRHSERERGSLLPNKLPADSPINRVVGNGMNDKLPTRIPVLCHSPSSTDEDEAEAMGLHRLSIALDEDVTITQKKPLSQQCTVRNSDVVVGAVPRSPSPEPQNHFPAAIDIPTVSVDASVSIIPTSPAPRPSEDAVEDAMDVDDVSNRVGTRPKLPIYGGGTSSAQHHHHRQQQRRPTQVSIFMPRESQRQRTMRDLMMDDAEQQATIFPEILRSPAATELHKRRPDSGPAICQFLRTFRRLSALSDSPLAPLSVCDPNPGLVVSNYHKRMQRKTTTTTKTTTAKRKRVRKSKKNTLKAPTRNANGQELISYHDV